MLWPNGGSKAMRVPNVATHAQGDAQSGLHKHDWWVDVVGGRCADR